MALVYRHDKRPWLIGYSGGKDSTLLCCLVMEMLRRLEPHQRNKTVYIISSDTLKRYKQTDDAIYLCPENDTMQPIVICGENRAKLRIQGVATGIIKKIE